MLRLWSPLELHRLRLTWEAGSTGRFSIAVNSAEGSPVWIDIVTERRIEADRISTEGDPPIFPDEMRQDIVLPRTVAARIRIVTDGAAGPARKPKMAALFKDMPSVAVTQRETPDMPLAESAR